MRLVVCCFSDDDEMIIAKLLVRTSYQKRQKTPKSRLVTPCTFLIPTTNPHLCVAVKENMRSPSILVSALALFQCNLVAGFSTGMARSFSTARASRSTLNMASNLKELCEVSKEACDTVAPMLQAFYKEIRIAAGEDSTAKLKSDATFFTIADGIVQHMFIEV